MLNQFDAARFADTQKRQEELLVEMTNQLKALNLAQTNAAQKQAEIAQKEKEKKDADVEAARLKDIEDKLKKEIKDRQARKAAINPPLNRTKQGALEKAEHLAGLTPEGVAGEILTLSLFHLFAALFHTAFLSQKRDFVLAQQNGTAYEVDANGIWPDIYPLDGENKPDTTQEPNRDGNASRAAIRANGFVPPPSLLEAYEVQFADFMLDMGGMNALTSYQKELLNVAQQANSELKADLASDRAAMAMRAAMPTPQPAPARMGGRP